MTDAGPLPGVVVVLATALGIALVVLGGLLLLLRDKGEVRRPPDRDS
jgi:hypothetical protein